MNEKTLLLMLLLACSSTRASEWVSVGKSLSAEEFADVTSVQIDGDIRHVLSKSVFPPHREKDPNDPNKWWAGKASQVAFNCKEGTSRRESMTIYYSDGNKFSIPDEYLPTSWRVVQPNTMLNEEILFICGWKAR